MNTKETKQKTCLCGCGETVRTAKALYRPGHDSRHVGLVARRVVLSGDKRALNELPSEALRARAEQTAKVLSASVLGELSGGWRLKG